jgi:hypothetical protein
VVTAISAIPIRRNPNARAEFSIGDSGYHRPFGTLKIFSTERDVVSLSRHVHVKEAPAASALLVGSLGRSLRSFSVF